MTLLLKPDKWDRRRLLRCCSFVRGYCRARTSQHDLMAVSQYAYFSVLVYSCSHINSWPRMVPIQSLQPAKYAQCFLEVYLLHPFYQVCIRRDLCGLWLTVCKHIFVNVIVGPYFEVPLPTIAAVLKWNALWSTYLSEEMALVSLLDRYQEQSRFQTTLAQCANYYIFCVWRLLKEVASSFTYT